MFGFVKKALFTGLTILSSVNLLTITPLKCTSMTNQECKVRANVVTRNNDEPVFYPFSIKTSKCMVVVTISMIHRQNCAFLML